MMDRAAQRDRMPARLRWLDAALLIACVVASSAVSIAMGQDANWDLQNYHYYDPWAWVAGRSLGVDIAAAQLQTYLNPLLDVPFYAMVAADWDPRAISAVLALPVGISAWLLAKLAWALFDGDEVPSRLVATGAALAIGLTAAMAVGTLGTTMNDWPGAAFSLAGLWLVVRSLVAGNIDGLPARTTMGAGLLLGIACGLKLTAAMFAIGLCAAILLRPPHAGARVREAVGFGLAVLAGLVVSYGYWAWQLWTHFGSPVFPFWNEWFRSPWWEPLPAVIRNYGPHTLGQWLEFPLRLREPRMFFVTEVPYTDARIPLLYVLAIVAGIGALVARAARVPAQSERTESSQRIAVAWTVVGVFWLVSFVMWVAQYSILRYIVALEVTTGLLVVGLIRVLVRRGYAEVVVVCVTIVLIATTRWADWWRVDYGPRWFDVRVPPVAPNALVLLVVDAPMGYVLPFFPRDARFVGVSNNVNYPGRKTLMEKSIADTISSQRGPIYALSFPAGHGEADLAAHGLRRVAGGCADVRTNMRTSPIELCRVERIAGSAR